MYSRISQKYTLAKKDKKELPGLKNLCAKLFGKKRLMLRNIPEYIKLLQIHNEARKNKAVSDELKKFREIKKLKTENQITRLFEIFQYIVDNSKQTLSKSKGISETANSDSPVDSETIETEETGDTEGTEPENSESETI